MHEMNIGRRALLFKNKNRTARLGLKFQEVVFLGRIGNVDAGTSQWFAGEPKAQALRVTGPWIAATDAKPERCGNLVQSEAIRLWLPRLSST
jgi:hypothetical protein